MGFLGIDSTSSATDQRIAASDQAQIYRGNVGQKVETGAVGLTGSSTLLGSGATQNAEKISGTKGNVTVQTMDPEVAQAAIDAMSGLAGTLGQNLSDFMTNANNNAVTQQSTEQTNLQAILDKMTSLISNEQPAGTVEINKTMLYIVLGVLALLGVVFYFFRK